MEVLCHRVLWSFALLFAYLIASRGIRSCLKRMNGKTCMIYASGAVFISINWGVYIWGVTHGRTIEVSLGNFMMPIVGVSFGRWFFKDRLTPLQIVGVSLAIAGVAFPYISAGTLPWVAVVVAVSFGLYGCVKRIAPLPALDGLTVETVILSVPALLLLFMPNGRVTGADTLKTTRFHL